MTGGSESLISYAGGLELTVSRLRAILRDIWMDGMQDGLSDALRTRVDKEVGDECRGSLRKRPVMFRVMDDNVWRVFSEEKEAADYADKIGMTYQGLYVRDGT
jgi:hypothetical protein